MRTGIVLSMVLLLAACGEASETEGVPSEASRTTEDTQEELRLELESRFNAYVRALVDDDAQALDALLSDEVKARVFDKGGDMQAFRDKMHRSMEREFGESAIEQAEHSFGVVDVTSEGDAAQVTVSYQGTTLEKPFFFVLESDEYKLNLVRPGFSNPLPEGAAPARDTYKILNMWAYSSYGSGTTMVCDGGEVFVRDGTTASVSCNNSCGWWHGSWFTTPYSGIIRYCDYNTWGNDVYINQLSYGGWDCNDYC
jgi:hypothetical protein